MGRAVTSIAAGLSAVLLTACDVTSVMGERSVSEGPCTMALATMGAPGEPLEVPYRLELVGREVTVLLDGGGWSGPGRVSYTETQPSGETEQRDLDVQPLNTGLTGLTFVTLGVHRLAFRDRGCRLEFEVEVVSPSTAGYLSAASPRHRSVRGAFYEHLSPCLPAPPIARQQRTTGMAPAHPRCPHG